VVERDGFPITRSPDFEVFIGVFEGAGGMEGLERQTKELPVL
jgi:hypothetical protein